MKVSFYNGSEIRMSVREFREFCCVSNIVLKDSFNGRVYTKLENYLDRTVTGFYPRFDLMRSNDSYSPLAYLQIVAWIDHDFEEDKDGSEPGEYKVQEQSAGEADSIPFS